MKHKSMMDVDKPYKEVEKPSIKLEYVESGKFSNLEGSIENDPNRPEILELKPAKDTIDASIFAKCTKAMPDGFKLQDEKSELYLEFMQIEQKKKALSLGLDSRHDYPTFHP